MSLAAASAFLLTAGLVLAQGAPETSTDGEWIQLFNGKNLDGWTPKITGFPLGENYNKTFRVEDGVLKVSYDDYDDFGGHFGHLFYQTPYSHYILAAEYRFVGEQPPGGPDWAVRNNGLMLHSQAPETMGLNQDFPISIEAQLLGGLRDGRPPHGQRLHAGDRDPYGREDGEGALHELDLADLARRSVGAGGDRGPR